MIEGLEEAIRIIDKEMRFAKKLDLSLDLDMAPGMERVKELIEKRLEFELTINTEDLLKEPNEL